MSKRQLVHVDTFVSQIGRYCPDITPVQVAGFKAYIEVNKAHYQSTMDSFIPYLEEYLGRKLEK